MVMVLHWNIKALHPATFSMELLIFKAFLESLRSAINEASTKGLQQNMVKTCNHTYYYEVRH